LRGFGIHEMEGRSLPPVVKTGCRRWSVLLPLAWVLSIDATPPNNRELHHHGNTTNKRSVLKGKTAVT
ncbi:MAG: hypothetical protein Q4P23_15375, partial [Micrococcaceae bacterium]|nr:hypothetical protein [Micrococcaceae bacterium]